MKVIIADDHRIVRESIAVLLESERDIELAGEASDGSELLEVLESTTADIVLLDVRMPDRSGLDVLEELKRRGLGVPVVVLSMFDNPSYVKRAIELGACGYLLQSVGKEELLKAVRVVADGGSYIQGEITAPLIALMVNPTAGAVGDLSRDDVTILEMLASGLDNKAMAQRLGISESALKAHLRTVYSVLNVKRRSEAVAVALRLDIIS